MFVREAARERPTHVMSRTLVQDGWWMDGTGTLPRKKKMEDTPFTNGGDSTGTRREAFDQDSSGRDLQQNSPQDKVVQVVGSERVSQSPRKGCDSRVGSCRVVPSTQASAQPTAVQRIWVVGITVTFFFS